MTPPSQQANNGAGFRGFAEPNTSASGFNATRFLMRMVLGEIATITLVKVIGVTNDGALSPVGYVDILPLVNQVDGFGNAVPHETIFGCPYYRLQGGTNAVIIDPVIGDIGFAGFASRDISSVIANRDQSNPGSDRRFDMSDGLYIGGFLNGTPTQYIQFSDAGIAITSPTQISLTVGGHGIVINSSGVTIDGRVFLAHAHDGVQSGGDDTGGVV